MRVFYVYFWKAYYRKTKKHQWIVQFRGKKHIVNGFKIMVNTESKSRKRNPHAVLYGRATKLTINQGIATLM